MTVLIDTEVSVIAPNFEGLKTTVTTYLDRSDLSSQVPIFIEMAHRKFNRTLFTPDRERAYEIDLVDGYVLPTDFYQMRSLAIEGSDDVDTPLEPVSYELVKAWVGCEERPLRYAVSAGKIYLAPLPDQNYVARIAYTATIPMLGTFQATNWLLEKHPDVYVYGALVQATAFLDATDARVGLWSAALEGALEEIREAGEKARWGGPAPAMKPPVCV